MMHLKNILFITVFTALGVSCSKDGGADKSGSGSDDGLVEVRINPDRTRILRNPLSGWVCYAGIGDGLADDFWEVYDNFDCKDAPDGSGKVRVSDYSSVLYIKAAWSAMNPEDGKYIWQEGMENYSKPAQRLKLLIDGAKERGMKIAFTINTNSVDKHENYTPDFVREAGADGYWTQTGSVKVFSGYPDDPKFQQYYEKFVKAFAAEYNNPDEVEFISGLGLGSWGECHTFKYSTGNAEPREAVFEWATKLYADAFTKVPVVTNYHRWVGCTTGADGNKYDPDSERLLQGAIDKGFSMRHDAFGMKHYYMEWEKNFISSRRYKVPVLAEGGWVKNSHGTSIKGDGYADYAAVRRGEYEDALAACVNMMDFRYCNVISNSETWSWFNEAFDLVQQFLQEGVYRLYPNIVNVPENVPAGSSVKVSSRWSNLGWAYCPTNIRQWKGRYAMAYALLDSGTGEPVHIFVDRDAQIDKCVKNSMQTYDFTIDLSGVKPGKYTWGMAIVNTEKDNVPGIELSVRKSALTSSGWLKVSPVEIM